MTFFSRIVKIKEKIKRGVCMTEFKNGVARIKIPTPYKVGDVYAYVLKNDALTLVDTGIGTQEAKAALIYELHQLHLTLDDFDQIVLTHHHPDHSGGLSFFHPSIPVLAHENNERWLTKSKDFIDFYGQYYHHFFSEFAVPSDRFKEIPKFQNNLKYIGNAKISQYLYESMELPGHSQWEVIETFGHASSQISLWNKQTGQLIAGDALLQFITPNPLMEPPLYDGDQRYSALLEHNKTLHKLKNLGIRTVLPGHGNIFNEVNEVIKTGLEKQEQRALKVWELIKQKPRTVYELCMLIFPRSYQKELVLTLSETVAQLDYLLEKEMIKARQEGEKLIYFA